MSLLVFGEFLASAGFGLSKGVLVQTASVYISSNAPPQGILSKKTLSYGFFS